MGYDSPYPEFWTVPIGGGTGVKTSISPDLTKQLNEVSIGGGIREWDKTSNFAGRRLEKRSILSAHSAVQKISGD